VLQREPHSAVTVNELNIFAVVLMQVADYLVIAETNKLFTARCCNMSVLCDSCASYLRGLRKNQLCPIRSLRGTRRSGSLGAHLHVSMKTHLWQFAEQAADVFEKLCSFVGGLCKGRHRVRCAITHDCSCDDHYIDMKCDRSSSG